MQKKSPSLVTCAVVPALAFSACALAPVRAADIGYVWTGLGGTSDYDETRGVVANNQTLFSTATLAPAGSLTIYPNWFVTNTPSGTDLGIFSTSLPASAGTTHAYLTIVNRLNANRTVFLDNAGGGNNTFDALSIAMQGSLTIGDPLDTSSAFTTLTGGLIRYTGTTGTQTIHRKLFVNDVWLYGFDKLEYRAGGLLTSGLNLHGRATFVYAPAMFGDPAITGPVTVTGGTLELAADPGAGNTLLQNLPDIVLRIRRDSTNDLPPASIPISGAVTIPSTPAASDPRVIVRHNRAMSDNIESSPSIVQIGDNGMLLFDPAVSELVFNARIVTEPGIPEFSHDFLVKNGPDTVVLGNTLDAYAGVILVQNGTLRLRHNATAGNLATLSDQPDPPTTTLEFNVADGLTRQYGLRFAGTGLIRKTGPGTARLIGDLESVFTGTFEVSEGTLFTSNNINNVNKITSHLRIDGGYAVLGGDENIADNTDVELLTGGKLYLEGHKEKIGTLSIASTGDVRLLGGAPELRIANDTITVSSGPGVGATPGMYQSGTTSGGIYPTNGLIVDVANGPPAIDFRMEDVTVHGPLVKTGEGRMLLSGKVNGALSVVGGILDVTNLNTAGAIVGPVVYINDGSVPSGAVPRLLLSASNKMDAATDVTIFGSGQLDLNGFNQTLKTLTYALAGNGSVTTGVGTLKLTQGVTAGSNNTSSVSGKIDLNSGVRTFAVSSAMGLAVSGNITNGTLEKTAAGTMTMTNVTGSAILRATGGLTRVNTVTVGGVEGAGSLELTGPLTDNETIVPHLFSGVISGSGAFTKSGGNSLTLSGAANNTLTGLVSVSGGSLLLNKTAGVPAIAGNLEIPTGGTVIPLANNQLAATSTISLSGGTLDLGATAQQAASLAVTSGHVGNGTLNIASGVTFSGADTSNLVLNVSAGGVQTTGGSVAEFRGSITGNSLLSTNSRLAVLDAAGAGSELTFANRFTAENGSTIYLAPAAPGDPALIDIDGGLLVGSAVLVPFTNVLLAMVGTTTVDLSFSAPLPPGTYNLIDFSNSPYVNPSGPGSLYPTLTNFTVIPPNSTQGAASLVGNVLKYTVVTSPGACCRPDHTCAMLTTTACASASGTFHGSGIACGANTDGDGVVDLCDQCPSDPNKMTAGSCGCGTPDTNSDGDTVPDCHDSCPGTVPGATVDSSGCPPVIPGDFDHDGDVDAGDIDAFVSCATRSGVPRTPGCAAKDFNTDNDVDMDDFALIQRCYSGMNSAANPACAN